ncbi:MAG: S8 family serine peptidase [Armatimonadota bacterium]
MIGPRRQHRRSAVGAVSLLLAGVLVLLSSPAGTAPLLLGTSGRDRLLAQLPGLAEARLVANNPSLVAALGGLVVVSEERPGEVPAYAASHGIELIGGLPRVTVVFKTPGDAAGADLTPYGAQVIYRGDRRVEVLVPIAQLPQIASRPDVAMVRPPQYFYPTVTSEGVALIDPGATFAAVGLDGTGVDVTVMDLGFQGYKPLLGIELPLTVDARSFRADGDIDSPLADVHGTGVAEIVYDMAPGATMRLWAIDTSLSVITAINQAIIEGTDVINMSFGSFAGPFDSTGPDNDAVELLDTNNILACVSAGNHAEKHYAGTFTDATADNFHEYAPGDQAIDVPGSELMIMATLSWWQTPGSNPVTDQDYDLVLWDPVANAEVARSGFVQDGDDPPWEVLFAVLPDPAITYELRIEAVNINPLNPGVFHLFRQLWDLDPTHRVRAGSCLVPAVSEGAFTVGATRAVAGLPDGLNVDDQEPFSSEGPTDDARIKPDIAAPDYVSTVTYGPLPPPGGFPGTSAAAPHVTGAAALVLQEDPARTRDDVVTRLQDLAVANFDLGLPGQDNKFGWGRCFLRLTGPRIIITSPRPGQIINFPTPTITGLMRTALDPIDDTTIVFTIDGAATLGWTFNPGTGAFQYDVPAPGLSDGRHTVTLTASDTAGNPGNVASVSFRIALPIASEGLSMVSFPARNLADPDPAAVLGLPVGDFSLARWLPDDTAPNKYHVFPDAFAGLEPPDAFGIDATVSTPPAGLGYFLQVPTDTMIALNGDPVDTAVPYIIRLRRGTTPPLGWNMIASPYNVGLPLIAAEFVLPGGEVIDLVEAIDRGLTNGYLFNWVADAVGGHYEFSEPLSGVMQANVGYWLNVSQDMVLRMFAVAGASVPAARAAEVARPDWRVRLSAQAGGDRDPMNYVGVSAAASEGYDILDVPEPPPGTPSVNLYIPHTDWGQERSGQYAQDIRAAGGVNRWEFEVAAVEANQQITLSWDLSEAPKDVQFVLKDLNADTSVFMRNQVSYTFSSGAAGAARRFELEAGENVGEQLMISGLVARPNRAGVGASIAFNLNKAAAVTVEIRNIAGRLVRRVNDRQMKAQGAQEVLWDGRSLHGTLAPPGFHLCRVIARSDDGQQDEGVVRLLVGR